MNSNDDIEQKLRNRDIRPTAMRVLVLRHLLEVENCVSLTELEMIFERADTSTLFRTLSIFEQKGLVHRIEDGSGISKFGLCIEHCDCTIDFQHYHFHCTNCKQTFCLKSMHPSSFNLPKGFSVHSTNLVLQGLCINCN